MSSRARNINDIIARSLKIENEGNGKVLTLEEAINRYVKPGITLHLACGLSGPSAAICEIVRQYSGKSPEFVLIQSALTGHALTLVHCNLIKKLIFTVCAGLGRRGGVIQRAYASKNIEFENWSLCSLQQRLMAGALGVSFMPTRSIAGSGMAVDNRESFREIEDPFGLKTHVGVVKALNPDLSIIHGCVADVYGNTILTIPYGDDIWGSLASNNGVLVTVEKIVPTALIRRYSALVKIPGYMVNSVSVTPLGVHPFALNNPGISDFDAYGVDRDYLHDMNTVFADGDNIDAWIKEWILDCPTHEHYLRKLGNKKINSLRGMVTKDIWNYDFSFESPSLIVRQDYTMEEMVAIVAAREIIKSVRQFQHRTILVGVGAGLIAAWLAYYQLRADGYEIELMQGNGQIGYLPQPAESLLRSGSVAPSAKMMTDVITTHGVFVGGKNNKCLSLLGAGEIDKFGNINSTVTSDGQFLSGSGGANDAANAQEVMVVIEQSKRRFVENLTFITCPGHRVTTVISSKGIFKKSFGKEELSLTACFPDPSLASLDEQIAQVQDNCGWTLKLANKVEVISRPDQTELELLRSLLPATLV